jgi:hypothetical protein
MISIVVIRNMMENESRFADLVIMSGSFIEALPLQQGFFVRIP